jgi:hypothetical protein
VRRPSRVLRGALLAAGACLARPVAAQIPDIPVPDTVAVAPDTVDHFAHQMRGLEEARIRFPVRPRLDRERLLPPLARIVLPRDSIEFINAETVGDLLAEVPGVYLWRLGWFGRAELPAYRARGATSVEYVIDGIPWVPMGPDSLAVDPSLFPVGMLDRMEIEVFPGLLRVHLMLRNHDQLSPRTRVAVGSGDFNLARYEGLFEKRFRSGIGLSLAAERLSSDPASRGAGATAVTNTWFQVDYTPSRRFGLQVRYQGLDAQRRASVAGTADTVALPQDGNRGDLSGRVFLRSGEGPGSRVDLLFSRSRWKDSLRVERWQVGLAAVTRGETWSVGATGWYGSRWTRWDGRVHAGWSPVQPLAVSVEGVLQEHDSSRTSRWIVARAGLTLPLGLTAVGTWREGEQVVRPSVIEDTAQALAEREVGVSWQLPWVGLRATWSRLGEFQPVPWWQLPGVDSIGRAGETEWVTLGARLTPRQWFTISGWYSNPVGTPPEGAPPTHSVIQAAIRSKFLRTFPSGIFDLKLAVSMETWGSGILGRTPDGDPVALDGATFFRALIQMQFAGVVAYIDRTNLGDSRKAYVPGFTIPRQAFTFGIRWTFLN